MSTTATSGLCIATWRSRSSALPDCATTSKPASTSKRAIPSRRSTESSASTTRTGVAPGRARRGGKSPAEAGLLELEDPLGLRHVGQRPEAEVAQVASRRQRRGGRLGGDDLSAVARGRDPVGAMDVDADVAVLGERRRAGVQADPDADGRRPVVAAEPSLRVDSCVCGL